ncbi:MAG: restriction endonuclease subunit S, partial [Eubacteriales bacterium]
MRITDIQDGKVNWDTVPFTTDSEPDTYLLDKGDIVFARTGATVGKSFLIEETPYPSVYASYLIRIRLLDDILPEYIYQFFNSQCYWDQITDKSVGVGQPNCNGTSLKELLIPLPPKTEQIKIVPSVRLAIEYVVNIETQKELLQEDIISVKAKILDLAFRGNLV